MAPVLRALMARRLVVSGNDIAALGPLAARAILLARDDNKQNDRPDPEKGLVHPQEINNNAMFALFGILGAAIVIGCVWFFFWAKNGGFYFREDDWDDYKSTVMRRKVGPNGTIYTDATPSTILGGGSVYKDVADDDGMTEMDNTTIVSATTGITGITGITGGVSDIYGREKRRKKREQKERDKERRREEKAREKEDKKRSKRKVGTDGIMIDEEAEALAQEQLRNYRSEKPARVGGINVASEASEWDGSTNPSWSGVGTSTVDSGSTVTSDLLKHQEKHERSPSKKERDEERAARKEAERKERREQRERERERDRELGHDRNPEREREKEKKTGGIRKVYSTADKNASREAERLRAEARRLRERDRAAAAAGQREREQRSSKRDFSWQHGVGDESSIALRRIDERGESVLDDVHEHEEGVVATGSNGQYARVNNNDYDEVDEVPPLRTSRALVPSSYTGTESTLTESEVSGHKVYKHPVHIPVSGAESSVGSEVSYAEERRKKRNGAGYRRHHRRDGDGDSSVGGY
ncbi:hypothetical protein B0H65DRAFT_100782 [Neurospora tetraspora]|uniref:Endosomal spry domain-containing protein n=1 Tax=Neurospora tetraspora TaxID=94610 RepID=A0AAE0MTS8_9PEZI|nr:hypothetical protein B0H65DRAFT_100782 [Neurospora tetraspora]